eukprot:Plantae.Rhodophyta-Hildenbrandia_rubra.ctg41400.p1 GENE.Plantae.Rhodophyta-Hildenbrandia_rubra.ctg41400~~Plantae.Rhodophyta-Hildenbrandia_rubra.ctg41400.p1  ORF type:complete len:424 (+),score=55.08 Plantae.Rhodophyta-Hildenbrandia_rubra.ctg41400:220-1491(+)
MLVAVVGCAHGELDTIYTAVNEFERVERRKISLLLCCGDFQAVRNEDDLECMACPRKYRSMNTFFRYYNGEKRAPVPTIFIGGNHEASNHLQELPLGGLVAPNIYYLGTAGVVWFNGLRIGGMSGIYASHDYDRPRIERPPYPGSQLRSVYHVRREDVDDLMQIERPLDVFIGHDWPQNITEHGDLENLLRRKPFLKTDIQTGRLGNPAATELLKKLKPRYYFAAHMHVKFAACVQHYGASSPTRFLALDKPLPKRAFLQILDLDTPNQQSQQHSREQGEAVFELDREWLSILRRRAQLVKRGQVTNEEMEAIEHLFASGKVPLTVRASSDFKKTAEGYQGGQLRRGEIPHELMINAHNLEIMKLLGAPLEDAANEDASASILKSPSAELEAPLCSSEAVEPVVEKVGVGHGLSGTKRLRHDV